MDDRRWQDLSGDEQKEYRDETDYADKQREAGIEPAKRAYKKREAKPKPETFKVKYIGVPDDGLPEGHTVEAFGRTFVLGQEVEIPVNDADVHGIVDRIDGNPHFDFVGERPKLAAPANALALNPQPIADPATYAAKA
jgi:hypothetical protein